MQDREVSFLSFRKNFTIQNNAKLLDAEIAHIKSLRLFSEDKVIEIRDGNGLSFLYKSLANSKEINYISDSESYLTPEPRLILSSAIPKGNRLDWLLQKGTEIGVTDFWFCNFPRSTRMEFSTERADRICMEAAIQSKRVSLPNCRIYESPFKMIESNPEYDFFFLDPQAEQKLNPREQIGKVPIVGPEGGFGDLKDEFRKMGMKEYRLVQSVLRIETAFIYLSSVLSLV